MRVAIDDTDSMDKMCTTYIISEIISRKKYDIIGNPELVRLNPNIKYKTRGNGALNINLGRGSGRRRLIGKIGDELIYSYEKLESEPDINEVMDFVSSIVDDYYVKDDARTNPGIVIAEKDIPEELYHMALKDDISIEYIENYLKDRGIYRKIGTGHGIIGAAASLAWKHEKITYELLDYRYPEYIHIDNTTKMRIASIPEMYKSTFNNIDIKNNYAAIFPKPKTPVIFGVRGVDDNDLFEIYNKIKENYNIDDERFVIYRTNQGTDDHIIFNPNFIMDLGSYALTGIIDSYPFTIEGGHTFVEMQYRMERLTLAAFEPTKEFRNIIRKLIPGDVVTAYGSYINGTLKLEKINIIELAKNYKYEAPECPVCHVKTKSRGRLDYRCPVCKRRYKNPSISEIKRELVTGFYEVPVMARRHLSMPVKLINYFFGNTHPDNGGFEK